MASKQKKFVYEVAHLDRFIIRSDSGKTYYYWSAFAGFDTEAEARAYIDKLNNNDAVFEVLYNGIPLNEHF